MCDESYCVYVSVCIYIYICIRKKEMLMKVKIDWESSFGYDNYAANFFAHAIMSVIEGFFFLFITIL